LFGFLNFKRKETGATPLEKDTLTNIEIEDKSVFGNKSQIKDALFDLKDEIS
jgi:hypothetical protein